MRKSGIIIVAFILSWMCNAADVKLEIDMHQQKEVSRVKYGFHYEEIGMIGDGSLHAELIRNRSFEEANPPRGIAIMNEVYVDVFNPTGQNKKVFHVDPLIGWFTMPLSYSPIHIDRTSEVPLSENNRHSLEVKVTNDIEVFNDKALIVNEGYYGMNLVRNNTYNFSVYIKVNNYKGSLQVFLLDENGGKISKALVLKTNSSEWTKINGKLVAESDCSRGMLGIVPTKAGTFQLDAVSLFPSDTWDNGKSIFRKDIMQNLVDFKPNFIRFPGGCIVHGVNEETMYHWKETIGNPALRRGAWSKWAPNYRTDGIGYHEFYELCEYTGADAMYVTATGMVCTEWVYRDKDRIFDHKPVDLDWYINDALDAIEYAIGDSTTKWGAERKKNGHSKPFPLKYIEIGNEDFGPVYYDRYEKMYQALKSKYPQLIYIANSPIGKEVNDKQKFISEFKNIKNIEIYDEHYYNDINWAIDNHYKFDSYKRQGIDLFIGELGIGGAYPNALLATGTFKMSMERNGDLNVMLAERPLMRNWDFLKQVDMPVLIMNNATHSVKTFNYYMTKMFKDNTYTTDISSRIIQNERKQTVFVSLGYDRKTKEYILKLINISDKPVVIQPYVKGDLKKVKAQKTQLSATKDQVNNPQNTTAVTPVISNVILDFKSEMTLDPATFVLYRFKK
jgi:alpha-L-arabinofuranosidase